MEWFSREAKGKLSTFGDYRFQDKPMSIPPTRNDTFGTGNGHRVGCFHSIGRQEMRSLWAQRWTFAGRVNESDQRRPEIKLVMLPPYEFQPASLLLGRGFRPSKRGLIPH